MLTILSTKSLDRTLVHGVAWTAGMQWLTQGLSWAATVIVAKALLPSDYGIVGEAMVFTAFIEMVSDFGMGTAVVKHRELTEKQIGQINLLCVLLGVLGWGLCCLAAYPMSRLFGVPALTAVMIVSGSGFFFSAFRTAPISLMQRDLQFREIAMNQGMQATVLSIAMVTFAVVLDLGYWSLVFGTVLSSVLSAALAFRVRPAAFVWPKYSELRGVLSFGSHMVGLRFSYYLTTMSDIFVGGKMLGTTPVGAYSLAMQIAGMPAEKISGLAMRVIPPIISAVQHDLKQLRRYILAFTEVVSLMTVPAGVGLSLVAADLVHWVLKPEWEAAILPLQILALSGVHRATLPIIPSAAAMIGLSRLSMRMSLGCAAVMPLAFFIGGRWGIGGIAAAWLIVYPFLTIPYYVAIFKKIELSPAAYLKSLWPAGSSAAMMAAAVWLSHHYLYPQAQLVVRVIADSLIGAAAYGLALVAFHRARLMALKDVYRLLRSK